MWAQQRIHLYRTKLTVHGLHNTANIHILLEGLSVFRAHYSTYSAACANFPTPLANDAVPSWLSQQQFLESIRAVLIAIGSKLAMHYSLACRIQLPFQLVAHEAVTLRFEPPEHLRAEQWPIALGDLSYPSPKHLQSLFSH
jgi:hypothetical protein